MHLLTNISAYCQGGRGGKGKGGRSGKGNSQSNSQSAMHAKRWLRKIESHSTPTSPLITTLMVSSGLLLTCTYEEAQRMTAKRLAKDPIFVEGLHEFYLTQHVPAMDALPDGTYYNPQGVERRLSSASTRFWITLVTTSLASHALPSPPSAPSRQHPHSIHPALL